MQLYLLSDQEPTIFLIPFTGPHKICKRPSMTILRMSFSSDPWRFITSSSLMKARPVAKQYITTPADLQGWRVRLKSPFTGTCVAKPFVR